MSTAILAAKEAVAEVEAWKWKALATTMIVGFAIGIGIAIWIKYTLVVQGIYKSVF